MSNNINILNDTVYSQGFGSRLHQALGEGNFREIVRRLGEKGLKIDYDRLRRYINDERRPDFDTLIALADLTDVSIDWLLKGTTGNKSISESPRIAEICKDLADTGWGEITLDELRGLHVLAKRRDESVQNIIKKLIAQGLAINEVFEPVINFRTVSLRDFPREELVDVDFLGDICDDAALKENYRVVKLPKSLIPIKIFSKRNEPIPQRDVYAYKISTNQLMQEGLRFDDLVIISGLETSLEKSTDIEFLDSIPVIYTNVKENKIYIGRSYRNSITPGFLVRPLRSSHPIQKLLPGYVSEFKFISTIITDYKYF
jgi:transcriptional regulator with XRE-family HTH domain